MLRRNFRILNLPKFDLVPIPRSYKEPQSKWKHFFQKYLWTCCRVSAQEHGVLWRRDAQGVHGLVRYFFLRLEIDNNTTIPCLNILFNFHHTSQTTSSSGALYSIASKYRYIPDNVLTYSPPQKWTPGVAGDAPRSADEGHGENERPRETLETTSTLPAPAWLF